MSLEEALLLLDTGRATPGELLEQALPLVCLSPHDLSEFKSQLLKQIANP